METSRLLLRVKPREIAYLRYTLESYDGMAVVSTLDPAEALIEVRVAPACRDLVLELLEDLARCEGTALELVSCEWEGGQDPAENAPAREPGGNR